MPSSTRNLVLTLVLAAAPSLHPHPMGVAEEAASGFVRKAWTIAEGLPQNSVSALARTRDGYLWVGTFGGLARFDGLRFEIFDVANTEELASNRILALCEDRHGGLWIGTTDGGVTVYRDGAFTRHGREDGVPGGNIWCIAEDREGTIWIGGDGGLASRRHGKFETRQPVPGVTAAVMHIHVDDDVLWFATSHGLSSYREGRFTVHDLRDALPSPQLFHVSHSPRGRLWLGGGPIGYREGERIVSLAIPEADSPGTVFASAIDRAGTQWVGGSKGLFFLRDRDDGEAGLSWERALEDSLAAITVRSILADLEGNVWIGTDGHGLVRLQEDSVLRLDRRHGLPASAPYAIRGDGKGGLWVSFASGEVVRVGDGRVTPLPELDGEPPVRGSPRIHCAREGVLWLVGTRYLARLRRGEYARFEHGIEAPVVALVEGSDGTLWLVGENGAIRRFRDGRLEGPPDRLRKSNGEALDAVSAAGRLADGSLWIASGRYLYPAVSSALVGEALALPARVRAVHEDGRGVLWVSTYGGGLVRLEDGTLTRFTTREGLSDNSLGGILEDGRGSLWINSNRGVLQVRLADLDAFAQGEIPRVPCVSIQSGEGSGASSFLDEDRTMWFPTLHGLVGIDPQKLESVQIRPIVSIEKFFADTEPIPVRGPVRVPPGRDDLEFQYSAPVLGAPERVEFRYRLVGHDEDWVDAGSRRTAHYTNIPPGEYRFEVQARMNGGLESEENASLEISLSPEFYQTTWFAAVCGLALVVLLVGVYKLRTLSMRLANRALQGQIEERRRRDRELRAKQEELQAILDNSAAVISVKDTEGRYLRTNRRFEELFHCDRDEIVGRTSHDVFPREQAEVFIAHDRQVLAAGTALKWEEEVSQDDGLHAYISVRAPLFDAEGKIYAVCTISTDITDRKRNETALRQLTAGVAAATGEAFFRSLVQHLAGALGIDYAFVGELSGPSRNSVSTVAAWGHGRPMDNFSYDLQQGPCARVSRGSLCVHERDVRGKFPKDELLGKLGIESYAGAPLTDSSDRVIGLLAVLHETPLADPRLVRALITVFGARAASELERNRSEAARRESESRFRTLVENAPDAIVVLDADTGTFVDANANATRLFGLSLDELRTRGPVEVSPSLLPDGRTAAEWAEKYIAAALRGEKPVFQWCHTDSRGVEIPCEIRLVRLPAAGRNLVRGSIIDISERKRLQAAVQRKASMEAVGRLAGGIAHDFNNLLTVLMSHGEILADHVRREGLAAEFGEHVEEIQRCTERAASLTRQLLAFSRQQVLQPKVLDPNRILAELEPMLRRLIRSDIEFHVNPGRRVGAIRADRSQIERVIMNLVINGSESMPHGGVLRVQTRGLVLDGEWIEGDGETRSGPHVLITVTDSGMGIAREHLPHIFDPFFTTKEPGKGTGLGLASVHGIVRQSGGHIAVSSEIGAGTSFEVYLPCVDDAPEERDEERNREIAPSGRETILVCDDDDGVRKSTSALLSSRGYRVLDAGSAEAALRIAHEHCDAIHLLITDVVMPEMNGRQLASRMRALRPEIRVLFISGYASSVISGNGKAGGDLDFLEKPFAQRDLLQRVRRVLDSPAR